MNGHRSGGPWVAACPRSGSALKTVLALERPVSDVFAALLGTVWP